MAEEEDKEFGDFIQGPTTLDDVSLLLDDADGICPEICSSCCQQTAGNDTFNTNHGLNLFHENTDIAVSFDELFTSGESLALTTEPIEPCITDTDLEVAKQYSCEWTRCLVCCCQVITEANAYLGGIPSSTVCTEVLTSTRGLVYVAGLVEIYRIVCRVATSMRITAISTHELERILRSIDLAWNNLSAFLVGAALLPKQESLVFTKCPASPHLEDLACGICLLSVTSTPLATYSTNDINSGKLTYSGRRYHATCANFWLNCVDQTLPCLLLPPHL